MKAEGRLEEVVEKVYAMSADNFDEMVPVVDMEFSGLDRMSIAGQEVEVLPTAQRLFANRLKVPMQYIQRCPRDLQAENLNFWLDQERGKRERLFIRFSGPGKVRACFTERYETLDNLSVLSKALEYGFDPTAHVQYAIDEEMMSLHMPDEARAFKLPGEDKILPGISLLNSEVGVLSFSIEAVLYRILCTNSLIARTSVSSKFRHISTRAFEQFPDILRGVIEQSRHSQNALRISVDSRVENPPTSIRGFAKQFTLSKKETEAAVNGWSFEPGYTMFSVINAFTAGARAPGLSALGAHKLEMAGGRILSMVKSN